MKVKIGGGINEAIDILKTFDGELEIEDSVSGKAVYEVLKSLGRKVKLLEENNVRDLKEFLSDRTGRPIKKIVIEVIPHERQRYETVGDYYFDVEGTLRIFVSEMSDNRHEMLVGLHELAEVLQTEHNGVSEKAITKFDIAFEEARKEGNLDEPGDSPLAPYRKEHCVATAVERLMAALLNVNWKEYEDDCNSL
jgi:predicted DNA-binding protein